MRKFLPFLLFTISACNSNQIDNRENSGTQLISTDTILGQKVQFEPTGLSSTCDSIIKMLRHPPHGLGSINAGQNGWISFDSLRKIFITVRHFDLKNNSCAVFKRNCHDIDVTTWESTDSLTIQTWTYHNSQNYEGAEYVDSIKKFYIKDDGRVKEISLTVINNNVLLNLTVGKATYTPLYEIVLEPTQNTIAKFDSLKNICNNNKTVN